MISLPGYLQLEAFHRGQRNVLYRGVREADGARVVIKVPAGDPPRARDLAAIWHEHSVLCDLALPGVVRAYALERCGDRPALVLEHVEGQPLSERLREGPLGVEEALRVAAAAAAILEEVHARGVLHKDVCPRNLLLEAGTGAVRLTGFGIAALLSQEAQPAVSPEALEGSLPYMSPEQTGRMNRVIDRRSDLYSLGITLYETLAGAPPFASAQPMELIHAHIARTPPPLAQRAPGVPPMVAAITARLLAKNAEDRYQTARGLRLDLEECLDELGATGAIRPFPPGLRDRVDQISVPQRLYGRAAEERALLEAFARAAGGATELLLVAGSSGIGKSALVHEIHKVIARRGGYFAAGKFDQLGRTTPYAPIARALGELLRQIVGEPAERLSRWRARIEAALGAAGQVVAELIPELEWILGPQPPVPPLGPAEAQNRFHLVFKAFVRALAAPEHPLVLFLDDLQWVDPASLRLLSVLLGDPDSAHLLLLGAFRANEVDAAHPLTAALAELRRGGAAVSEIDLGPLAPGDVIELLRDTLGAERERVEPLARAVTERTQGNPFFLRQLLAALHAEGLLRLDADAGEWTWDLAAIEARPSSSDVVELLAAKIGRLPPGGQRALTLAACIGHQFDLRTLAVIHERPAADTAADLWEALRAGLVVPLDADYRLVHGAAPEAGSLPVRYRFQHDRVQQAAYSLIEEARRRELHLRIGRLMLASAEGEARDEALFEIVNHLDVGAALIEDPAERAELAALNLAAGRKARAATAYAAALGYLRAGMALLGEDAWEARYELALALHRERAEAESLNGHFDEADRLYEIAAPRARAAMDEVGIRFIQVNQYQLQGRYAEAIRIQRAALALLGWEVPEAPEAVRALLERELASVERLLGGRAVEDLLAAPPLRDPEKIAMLELLQPMVYAAYLIGDQTLANLALTKMTTLSMEHGSAELSPFGYIGFAMVRGTVLGDYPTAQRFARVGISLCDQFENVSIKCKASFLYAADVQSWTQPIGDADPYYEQAYRYGMESGDWVTMGYMIIQSGADRLIRGMPLPELRRICEEHLSFLRRAKNQDVIDLLRAGVLQPLLHLAGETDGPRTFDGGGFSEERYLERYGHLPYYQAWLYHAKIRAAYLFDDRASWPALIDKLPVIEAAVPTHAKIPETTFYVALTLLSMGLQGDGARERFDRLEARLRLWAEHGPANVLHKHRLVLAELARVEGRRLEAMDLYEEAIELARRHGYVNNEALANELYARSWLAQGRDAIAEVYLRRALHLYEAWGALGKAAELRAAHARVLAEEAPAASLPPGPDPWGPRAAGGGEPAASLDLWTVIQAGQALSGERALAGLLDRLMRLVISSAGATRGSLILPRDGALRVEARMEVDPDVIEVGVAAPLESRGDLAHAVVHYVARTREPVVIGSAAEDPRFAADPHVAAGRARSILCLALSHQGRLSGLLYLENHVAEEAFPRDRIQLLELLSTQAAIAVENALLYEHLSHAGEELRATNERLEAEVAARTAEIREANERLLRELVERERAEQARVELHEEIIRMQEQQLEELSAPLIPLSGDVLVMPLIGSVDGRRAAQVLEAVLKGAAERSARAVILDLTGARGADAEIAVALTRAAAALRLLGTEAILTGIRPEMARALVEHGADLGQLTVRGTLQSGIERATARRAGRMRR